MNVNLIINELGNANWWILLGIGEVALSFVSWMKNEIIFIRNNWYTKKEVRRAAISLEQKVEMLAKKLMFQNRPGRRHKVFQELIREGQGKPSEVNGFADVFCQIWEQEIVYYGGKNYWKNGHLWRSIPTEMKTHNTLIDLGLVKKASRAEKGQSKEILVPIVNQKNQMIYTQVCEYLYAFCGDYQFRKYA